MQIKLLDLACYLIHNIWGDEHLNDYSLFIWDT